MARSSLDCPCRVQHIDEQFTVFCAFSVQQSVGKHAVSLSWTPIPPSSVAIATPEYVPNGARQSPYVQATLAVASSAILRVIYAAARRLSYRAQTVTDGNGVRREPSGVSGREKTREKGPTVSASNVEHGYNDGSTVPTRERQLYRPRCRRCLAVAPGTNETAIAPRATERAKPP